MDDRMNVMRTMEQLDPSQPTESMAKKLADHLESYLKLVQDIRVAPPDIEKKYGKQIEEGDKRTRKLIKKLRKGDFSNLFKEDI